MKIVHVVSLGPFDDYGTPGPCNVALNQLSALRKAGFDCVLLTTHARDTRRISTVSDGEVPISSYRRRQFVPRSLASIFSFGLLARVLREARRSHCVLHLHCSRDLVFIPLMFVLSLTGTRAVFQPHGQIQSTSFARSLVDKVIVAPLLSAGRSVLALQEVEKRRLIAMGVKPASIRLAPNRIMIPARFSRSLDTDRLPRLGFVAHLRPEKRVDLALALSRAMISLGYPHELIIAGADGGDRSRVESAVLSETQVSYAGTLGRQDVWDLLRYVDLLLFPSDDEPFGMSLVEGLSVGTPAVCGTGMHAASNLGDREGVIRVDFAEVRATAELIMKTVSCPDDWRELSRAGRKWVEENLDAYGYAVELGAIYKGEI